MFDHDFFLKPIEFVKGVGPVKATLLQSELKIFNIKDVLRDYPIRYENRQAIKKISEINQYDHEVQLVVKLLDVKEVGVGSHKRLNALVEDKTGTLELVWFRSISWLKKSLILNEEYIIYGKIKTFKGRKSMPHPEMEVFSKFDKRKLQSLKPIYRSTEKLTKIGLDSKGRQKILFGLIGELESSYFSEYLPENMVSELKFLPPFETIKAIHFPTSTRKLKQAQNRIKFEEFFFLVFNMLSQQDFNKKTISGHVFEKIGKNFNAFYTRHLGFELTTAQKRVIKEIRADLGKGSQMNRLLQGDVGSGKTIVGFLSMLIALDNGFQACLMAPTEILAQQHLESLKAYCQKLKIPIALLTGSVKGSKRKELLRLLRLGEVKILIGTHALIEDPVVFSNLGLVVIDEQHRFGVAQRAKLWSKGKGRPPHVLVMTATPIPRTLQMTIYADLDVSIIDELPPGRKPIKTIHKTDRDRPEIIQFLREEIAKGRQVYVVYPLIEESATLDLEDLSNGYEKMMQYFPRPDYQISIVHGRMKPADKDYEMGRFARNETHIMIATTVIEVGVNVPNASVMIIENAERFGLAQLHQLRGRVGRGADQSYCILVSRKELSEDARIRIKTMTSTNDGFKISEVDLKLRGPGNIHGTQQSGVQDFLLANLVEDQHILGFAKKYAQKILDDDPHLENPNHSKLRQYLEKNYSKNKIWSKIS